MQRSFVTSAAHQGLWLAIPAVLALSLALGGCDAYNNKGFNQAFDKSLHDSCVKSAIGNSAPPDKAEAFCSCMVGQLSSLSVQEKQHLDMSSPKVQAATAHCQAQAH